MSALPVVRAEGPPLERGRMIGRGLAAPIARSLEFYWRYLVRRGVGPALLPDLLGPYLAAAERKLPELVELLSGMAEGAGVSFWELFYVNAFEELDLQLAGGPVAGAVPERCSTVTVTAPGVTLLGHNEQWLAGDLGNAAVVVEVPDDGGPAVVSPTVACCLPAVGVNAYGAAQGIQSLAASDDRVGVPRVLVSRHALAASSPADALRRATLPGRAGGYGHSLAFPGGHALIVETTATRFAVAGTPGPHTNHYLDPELARLAPPPGGGSAARLARLRELLAERVPATPAALGELLADHAGHPQAICEHDRPPADGGPADEADAVVFSMVCDLEAGRLWVAPGPPCTTPYEEVELRGVV
jgi:isopenicillin-N N-acyltransferase like protein